VWHSSPLAPFAWIGQWTDTGVFLVFPCWSEKTYWTKYWRAKHKEMEKHGKDPKCTNKDGPHTVRPGNVPADDELTVNRTFNWLGAP